MNKIVRLLTGISVFVFLIVSVSSVYSAGKNVSEKIAVSKEVKGCIKELKSSDAAKRAHAASKLAKMGKSAKPALDSLLKVLNDEDPGVKLSAEYALGKIEDYSAVGPLIEQLSSKNSIVKFYAVWALKNITNQSFGEDAVKWKNWWKENGKSLLKK